MLKNLRLKSQHISSLKNASIASRGFSSLRCSAPAAASAPKAGVSRLSGLVPQTANNVSK
ncbi:hypothetical protein KEM55_001681 [Ascosphaera atra]|nr:hypothetical protein KEM55_001681 [Ascosphaera atra]